MASKETNRKKRLKKELEELEREPLPFCVISPIDDNMRHWQAAIHGPEGTPYEGGVFVSEIKFANDYPFRPPTLTQKTRIFHMNFNKKGKVCVEMFESWDRKKNKVEDILHAIYEILTEPSTSEAINEFAAQLWHDNKNLYQDTAKTWTLQFASSDNNVVWGKGTKTAKESKQPKNSNNTNNSPNQANIANIANIDANDCKDSEKIETDDTQDTQDTQDTRAMKEMIKKYTKSGGNVRSIEETDVKDAQNDENEDPTESVDAPNDAAPAQEMASAANGPSAEPND